MAGRLERTLGQLFLSLGVLCDIEVKGTITTNQKSGGLAKLPFNRHQYPCNRRDETDSWNYRQLETFTSCPTVNSRRIDHILGQIDIDDEKVVAFAKVKRRSGRGTEGCRRPSPLHCLRRR